MELVEAIASADAVLIADTNALHRLGTPGNQLKGSGGKKILIDHHTDPEDWFDMSHRRETASSTGELVYELIAGWDLGGLSPAVAQALYVAIMTDTGSFRFSNTNRAAFAICTELVALGVDPYIVAKHLYGTYSLGRIKLLNLALDSIELSANGRLSVMILTEQMLSETGTRPEDVDGLIHSARSIKDVRVAALIHEYPNGSGGRHGPRYHVRHPREPQGAAEVGQGAAESHQQNDGPHPCGSRHFREQPRDESNGYPQQPA